MPNNSDPSAVLHVRPSKSDAAAVIDLMSTVDIAEYGEPDSELDDLLQEWEEIDLSQDAWLVYDQLDRIVGYGKIAEANGDFQMDFYVHPHFAPDDLRIGIISRCEERVLELQRQMGKPTPVELRTIASQANQGDNAVLEKLGYRIDKYYLRMEHTMNQQPDKPAWPAGVQLRTIVPGEDDAHIFEFVNRNITHAGRTPGDFERWRSWMMRADHFIPELWFLLFADEEIIGVALCYDYEEYGWVRQLAVAPSWRRHRLGTALLQHSFYGFYARGHRRVALGVEASNLDALQFYERVGMHRVRQFNEYIKHLPAD
jgi:mycothiol synthase